MNLAAGRLVRRLVSLIRGYGDYLSSNLIPWLDAAGHLINNFEPIFLF